eukprot:180243_1
MIAILVHSLLESGTILHLIIYLIAVNSSISSWNCIVFRYKSQESSSDTNASRSISILAINCYSVVVYITVQINYNLVVFVVVTCFLYMVVFITNHAIISAISATIQIAYYVTFRIRFQSEKCGIYNWFIAESNTMLFRVLKCMIHMK